MTRILLAAGGTGGHVFPAVAVAEQLAARGLKPVFITDARGKPMIPNHFSVNRILAASPYGKTKGERVKGLLKLAIGAMQTLAIMTFYRPKLVIGFGGYPAVAPVLVGKMLNRKTMLHEQNAFFGRANHFLARYANKIALSWQNTNNISPDMKQKAVTMGMPVREAFREIGVSEYEPPQDGSDIHILIVGGSLGATIFGDTVFGACCIDDCDSEHNAVHVAGVRISEKIVFQPTTANDHVAVEPQCTSNTRTE